MTVTKESGLRVLVNSKMASLVGNRMPGIAVAVQPFETTTEASADSTRLTFAPKRRETGVRQRKKSIKDEFSARIRRFFHKDALKAPGEFDTILHALERPKVAAAVRNQDPLAMARPRGIEAKRRMLADEGGVLSAERVGGLLTMSRQAVETRRKAGRLIGVSLGRRGFLYPAWQFSERGTLPGLEAVLDALKPHGAWTKLVYFTSENTVIDGERPLDVLRSGDIFRALEMPPFDQAPDL